MEGYTYQTLSVNELTRVVVVEPGTFNDPVRCSLCTIPKQRLTHTSAKDSDLPLIGENSDSIATALEHSRPSLSQAIHRQLENTASDDLVYNALSYVWGPPELDAPLICDGQHCRITINLHQALRRFRKPNKRLYIWVDAICINQKDAAERSEQVQLMKQIYEQAEHVLIWLGDEDEETHLVLRLLGAHRKKADQPWFHVRTEFGADAPEWAAMIRWLNRPWFWRVWTIQEARVAKCAIVYFGPHSIDLAIVDSVLSLHISRDDNHDLAGHLEEAFRLPGLSVRLNESNTFSCKCRSLLDLLLMSRRHQATDPRDKVYGLLGLVQDMSEQDLQSPLINPDYKKAKEKVYRDTALFIIVKDCSLKVIQATYHGEQFFYHRDVPSWVPRWDQQDGPILLAERSGSSYSLNETRIPVANLRDGEDGLLSVNGTVEATVRLVLSKMSQKALRGPKDGGEATVFSHLWAELRNEYGNPIYLGGRHLILAFIEALTIGINGRGEFFYYDYDRFFETLHWMWGHVLGKNESDTASLQFCSDDDAEYIQESQPEDTVAQTLSLVDPAGLSAPETNVGIAVSNTHVEPFQLDNALAINFPTHWGDDEDEEASPDNFPTSFRFEPGSCQLCRDPQEQESTISLHSYLTRNPNREGLPGSEKDPKTFQYRINDFFHDAFLFPCVKGPSLSFLAPCIDACNFRRFFITDNQRIGIGPQAMRAGDIVTCILGATFPWVLRKAEMDLSELGVHIEKTRALYHFIGECYIQDPDCSMPAENDPEIVAFDLV